MFVKEDIMRRAWQCGTIELHGAILSVPTDLSRDMLRRKMIDPVLEYLRNWGLIYRWG